MGPETFEDKIKKKFEGQTIKAPKDAWSGIENSMNASFVHAYQNQQIFYKWVSVAAIFVAILLLGVLLAPFEDVVDNELEIAKTSNNESYNALLSNDFSYGDYFNRSFSGGIQADLSFSKVLPTEETRSNNQDIKDVVNRENQQQLYTISSKEPSLNYAELSHSIYPYATLSSSYSSRKKSARGKEENAKLWAGVEAGAGTFEGQLGDAALSNSLNPAGLASAIGSGNFVNPTTNISPEMNQAVSTSVALDFGLQINKKWTLESGLAYTSVDNTGIASINVLDVFTIDNTNFIAQGQQQIGLGNDDVVAPSLSAREATIEVERNYDHEVEVNNRVQFASIPLKAGYFVVNKKFSLRLNAGLSANYLMEGDISDPTSEILNSDQLNLYNEWSFDGIGGMEFGYSVFERFNFTLEPNYRHAITPISNTSNTPSRFVLQTGFRYTIN